MGLDMYAFTVSAQDAGTTQVDIVCNDGTDNEVVTESLFYWRKFNALHGWMEQLYRTKGGTAVSFNCNTVRLDNEDLDRLLREADTLKPVEGSFFGAQVVYPEDLETITVFVAKAKGAIAQGRVVYYDSWW